ncbi:type II toxin-antitoxin system PemK/MazF family toxin [Dokdonella koreensis]|uniref:type II toxin-antitoxin system PemK/MazF family toxin n=1 Tax=Dokdonella koreensis TaxID=323415 RepID=UPI000A006005|nr:type II toxin-antitoxin system PemK/MazF family toxin [Dokdonella koreensis]
MELMPIHYHPALGEVLWCDYKGMEPEMVKKRLSVVVVPKSVQRPRLTTVVPISATVPEFVRPWHVRLERDPYPKGSKPDLWVKCDMLNVVSFDRLDGYHYRWNGRRQYQKMQVSLDELRRVRAGVIEGLGLSTDLLRLEDIENMLARP